MKNLFIALLLTASSVSVQANIKTDSVYLCMGHYSHAYHISQYCKGLRNCSTPLKKVPLSVAIKMNRHKCGYCNH